MSLEDYKKNEPEIEKAFQQIEEQNNKQNSSAAEFKFWAASEILAYDFGEEQWLVESILPQPGIAILSGNPGDFKSWLSLHIALCVTKGLSVFSKFAVQQGGVLIIDEENYLKHVKKRLAALGITNEPIYYLPQSDFKLENQRMIEKVLAMAKDKQIKLVIMDSFVRIHGGDENNATEIAEVFGFLQQFGKAGISVLLIHHNRKPSGYSSNNAAQTMRGSSDILAKVDSHIAVERKKGEDILVISQPKLRQDEPLKTFEVKILRNGKIPCGFEYSGEHNEKQKKAEEVAEVMPSLLFDGMRSRQAIHEELDFGKTAVDDGIKIAVERGIIEEVPLNELPSDLAPKERKKKYYRLKTVSE